MQRTRLNLSYKEQGNEKGSEFVTVFLGVMHIWR